MGLTTPSDDETFPVTLSNEPNFVVICAFLTPFSSSMKTSFYTSDQPFRQISQETGKIRWTQVRNLVKGKIYTHGSLQALSDMTGWKGPRVLYMGDNLWADLVDARRLQGWRTGGAAIRRGFVWLCRVVSALMKALAGMTGAVIRELEGELEVQTSPDYLDKVNHLVAVTTVSFSIAVPDSTFDVIGRPFVALHQHVLNEGTCLGLPACRP